MKTARINIVLPPDLKRRMKKAQERDCRLNWSSVANTAFRARLGEIPVTSLELTHFEAMLICAAFVAWIEGPLRKNLSRIEVNMLNRLVALYPEIHEKTGLKLYLEENRDGHHAE